MSAYIVTTVAFLSFATGTAYGQTARTFEELRDGGRVAAGDTVTVEDEAGRRFRGVVGVLDDDSLVLRMKSARNSVDRAFTESEVTRVQRGGTRAMALSTLTGAGAAFALTAVAAARYGRNEGAESCGACLVQWSTMTAPIGAAAGALIGFAIDKAKVRTVFARATAGQSSLSITPLVARNTFGGFATIRF
jgi:hypothetical protein